MSDKKPKKKKSVVSPGQAGPDGAPRGRLPYFALAILSALTAFIVFLPTLNNYFLVWDDTALITANRAIRTLDMEMARTAFGSTFMATWLPLTIMSFAVDNAVWGLRPFGFHLTNNILHSLNAMLVFVLAVQLVSAAAKGRGEGAGAPKAETLAIAFTAAVLFAVHPLRVESVAWATERKDVLFLFFYLLSVVSYLKYAAVEAGKWSRAAYVLSFFFAACSMMSKPMAVTLPMTLVILDFYPLGRVFEAWRAPNGRAVALMRVALEKAPFFLLTVAQTAITMFTHIQTATITARDMFTPNSPFCAAKSAALHLQKLLLPINLIPRYRLFLPEDVFDAAQIPYYIVFAGITVYVVAVVRKRPYLLAAWFFYNTTLSPVSFWTAGADRFTYLPSIGLTMLAALPAAFAVRKTTPAAARAMIIAVFVAVVAALIFQTTSQIRVWRNTETLWTRQIEGASHNHGIAYNNIGYAYEISGDAGKALDSYTRAIEKSPAFATAHYNRAGILMRAGRTDEAIKGYEKAVELSPSYKEARLNLGNIHGRSGGYPAAIDEYTKALEIDPAYRTAYRNRARVFEAMGEAKSAIADLKKILELNPDDAEARRALSAHEGAGVANGGALEKK